MFRKHLREYSRATVIADKHKVQGNSKEVAGLTRCKRCCRCERRRPHRRFYSAPPLPRSSAALARPLQRGFCSCAALWLPRGSVARRCRSGASLSLQRRCARTALSLSLRSAVAAVMPLLLCSDVYTPTPRRLCRIAATTAQRSRLTCAALSLPRCHSRAALPLPPVSAPRRPPQQQKQQWGQGGWVDPSCHCEVCLARHCLGLRRARRPEVRPGLSQHSMQGRPGTNPGLLCVSWDQLSCLLSTRLAYTSCLIVVS